MQEKIIKNKFLLQKICVYQIKAVPLHSKNKSVFPFRGFCSNITHFRFPPTAPRLPKHKRAVVFFVYIQILHQEKLLRPPNCRQICQLRLSIHPAKGFIPKSLFVPSNAKYSFFHPVKVIYFPISRIMFLKCQKLGLAKMKNQKCNFCKSINTLKINKINSKNVKMSKCQKFSRA